MPDRALRQVREPCRTFAGDPCLPEFKPLELADRAAVEAVVHSFPPYSDFSFTNLYAWEAQVSSLHGNLAVRFADYISGAPFFSFIGRHRVAETAMQLLDLAKQDAIARSCAWCLRARPRADRGRLRRDGGRGSD
jgi:hypothetical protein